MSTTNAKVYMSVTHCAPGEVTVARKTKAPLASMTATMDEKSRIARTGVANRGDT